MDNDIHSRLVTLLLEISGMDDYTVRTSLILNIPNYQNLGRHNQDARADITYIVSGLDKMRFSNGAWELLTFIDNALARVPPGTLLNTQLRDILNLLKNGQSGKEQSDEVDRESEKKEVLPIAALVEVEKQEDSTGDMHNDLAEQIQVHYLQIEDVQKLLLNSEESLNKVCMLFKTGKAIMRDQCDKAISHINNLRVALPKAHALYNQAPYIQGALPLLSFQVKVMLNATDDQIDELVSNIHIFRDSCPLSLVVVSYHQSENEREKIENDRKKISEQLVSLLEALKEINMILLKYLQNLSIT